MPASSEAKLAAAVPPADRQKAFATLALAFAGDSMMRWTFPDPERYFAIAPDFMAAFGGKAFEHQCADQTGDCAGVALWLPPGIQPDKEAMGAIMESAIPLAITADIPGLMEQIERFHPKEPHWYLPLIGVDPVHQRKGCGSALLQHALRRCDKDRLPAYLEASSSKNVQLYERHGFRQIGVIQQGSSPELVPMLRPARTG